MADIDDLIRRAASDKAASDSPNRFQSNVCEALMLEYFDFAYRLALNFLNDADDADDAAQESILQAAQHIDQYQYGTNLKSWVARITINVCRMRYRSQKSRQRLQQVVKLMTFQTNALLPGPEESAIQNEQHRLLRKAVDSLDEKHRATVILRYMQGLSVPEIAQILEEKEGTIHSRLHYAHHKLRERLEGMSGWAAERKAGTP